VQPPTPPPPTYGVTAVVFLDDNGNGVQDPTEGAVVPNATVEIDGRTGTSQIGTGAVSVTGVRAGTFNVGLPKLPPFYQPVGTRTITVPQTNAPLLIPVTLPLGDNIPGLYLSQGDSISQGDPGSSDSRGFRSILQSKLRVAMLRANLDYRGTEGGTTVDGAAPFRVDHDMRIIHPAFTLIDWGVNDWNIRPQCDDPASADCPTIPNLQHIVEVVKAAHSQPCIATLTPPNLALDSQARYDWVIKVNGMIRTMAKSEGALLVDVGDAFVKAGNSPTLFYDHIHPNDAGYALMADTFYAALLGTSGSTSAGSPLSAFSLFKPGLR
jgi:lysophospholipase L1-like esterase